MNKNKYFDDLKQQIEGINKICFIHLNDSDSYESFLSNLNEILLKSNSSFLDVKTNFNEIDLSIMNPIYTCIRNHEFCWKEYLKTLILKRKSYDSSYKENSYLFNFKIK